MSDVELFVTGSGKQLLPGDKVVIRVGTETRTLSAGEWLLLIAKPQRVERALYPGGIDDLVTS